MVERQIALRSATVNDMEFLRRLYCDTRKDEVALWGWPAEQQELFLRMQFEAQHRSYRTAFPNSIDRIICADNELAGRLMVNTEASALHLIDISLIEEYRNHGVGGELIRGLLNECEAQDRSMRLQVLQGNPAIRLYLRLGFVQSAADPMYVQMAWNPPRPQEGD